MDFFTQGKHYAKLFNKHEELQDKINKEVIRKVSCCLILVKFEQVSGVFFPFKNMLVRLYQVSNTCSKSKN